VFRRSLILSVVVAAAAAWSQQADDGGAYEARFRQMDRNGDGFLTAEELPGPNLLRQLDRDGDQKVSTEEGRAWWEGRQGGTGQTPAAPQAPPAVDTPRPHGGEGLAAGLDAEVLAQLDASMHGQVAVGEVAGLVALIGRHDLIGYREAFGMRDREAGISMTADTIFRLYSMTKPIVVAAALALYEEGLFDLDDPISDVLPEWGQVRVAVPGGEPTPAQRPVTVRDLMRHSSGLHYGGIELQSGASRQHLSILRTATSLRDYVRGMADVPLEFEPGTAYAYGQSTDVLGGYMEAVAGQTLDLILQERLFGPLGMVDTGFWVPAEKEPRLAVMYTLGPDGLLQRGRSNATVLEKPDVLLAGQGLLSTADDYARFCRMLLQGGELDSTRVLKPETVDMMFANQLLEVYPEGFRKYGLGAAVDGEGGYSWGGAAGTKFWVDRGADVFGVFMVQTQRYRADVYSDFHALAYQALGQAATTALGEPAAGQLEAASAQDLPDLLSRGAIDALVIVSDLAESMRFYGEGLGLVAADEEVSRPDGSRMARYRLGHSIIELRQLVQTPEADSRAPDAGEDLKTQIAAARGIRMLYMLVEDIAATGTRLEARGFPALQAQGMAGIGSYRLTTDPDGNVIGLKQAPAAAGEILQIMLNVPDEASFRLFCGATLGLPPAGEIPIRSANATEVRFAAGESIIKFIAPEGDLPAFEGPPEERIGLRTIGFAVSDLEATRELLERRDAEVVYPTLLAGAQNTFWVVAPDGTWLQFVEEAGTEVRGAIPGVGPDRSIEAQFARRDRNGDGVLTEDELPNARVLQRLDADGDGAVTPAEAVARMGRRGAGSERAPAGVPAGDAEADAAGDTQLFERATIAGLTDVAAPTQGMAFVDLDLDGRLDILVSQDRLRVFLGRGEMRFEEHPLSISGEITATQAPTVADFSGDGLLDIYLGSLGGRNRAALLVADGAWDSFTDRAEALGVANAGAYARGQVSVGDVDRDGWLDLAIAANAIGSGGPRTGRPLSRLYVYCPAEDGVYENGRYEDIGGTDLVPGFGGVDRDQPDPERDVNGMCCVLRDLDDDGDLDLLRAAHNDMLRGDPTDPFATGECPYGVFAWRNELAETGVLRFTPVEPGPGSLAEHGKSRWNAGMGWYEHEAEAIAGETILTGDTDNDGDLDVLITGITGPEVIVHSLWVSARFWENRGGLQFAEGSADLGLGALNWFAADWHEFWGCEVDEPDAGETRPRGSTPRPKGERLPLADHQLYFGNSVLADFNNDGWLDLLQVTRFNGRAQIIGAWRSNLFMNRGDGSFELVPTGLSGIDAMGLTAQAVDLNADGLIDIYLMQRNKKRDESAQDIVWLNTGRLAGAAENHWLTVHLTGLPQRQLIGARIVALDSDTGELLGRRDYVVDHMRGSHDPDLHLGLGARTRVDLQVTLPDGTTRSSAGIGADQAIKLDLGA
jgi:CubicO group peptidase (beta-lactamase class C family)/catechol 2,3-dioxygenase-like lactoylglutathione lyase family enzyme